MKQPIRIISTDWHLNLNNIEYKKKLLYQMLDEADKIGCKNLIIGGDILDERKGQPQSTLNALGDIFKEFDKRGFKSEIIPGNHSKSDYQSERSYLDEFEFHPGVSLYTNYKTYLTPDKIAFHFIPYFKEETTYLKYLEKAIESVNFVNNDKQIVDKYKHMLITHISISGIFNNDKAEIINPLNKEYFSVFDKVLIGHIHDRSKIGNNIYYIGSLNPDNFAEDDQKGYTILYSDNSIEFKTLDFIKYINIKIDLEKETNEQIDSLLNQYANCKDKVRFTFSGSVEKLLNINKSKFEAVGIDVKLKRLDIEKGIIAAEKKKVTSFDKSSIKEEFEEFCKVNKLGERSVGVGRKYLERQLG